MSAGAGFRLVERFPGIDDYRRLRSATGLSAKSAEAAVRGLANTLYGVSVVDGERVIGMGRIIGDGGCFFVVVDIAVLPEFQKRGLGKRIMDALDAWLRGPLREWAESMLEEGRLRREGYFDPKPIRAAWAQHVRGRASSGHRLWSVLMFQAWLQQQGGSA